MLSTIIACIIANLLTIVIIGAAIYFAYKKNQERVDAVAEEIKEKVEKAKETVTEVKDAISDVSDVINEIKNKFEGLPI